MQQLSFAERPRKDGKKRRSPGPVPRLRSGVPHVARPAHARHNPVHITLRAVDGLPSFRLQVTYQAFELAIRLTRREDFRIVEHSVQANHIHLLVEANDADALASGMKSFSVRANRLFNRTIGRGRGKVWKGRHHRTELKTPRQVRNALVYVLNNARKHGIIVEQRRLVIDPCSSAAWFEGWSLPRTARAGTRPTEQPRTALLRYLWQKHGRLHPNEVPVGAAKARSRARSSRWQ